MVLHQILDKMSGVPIPSIYDIFFKINSYDGWRNVLSILAALVEKYHLSFKWDYCAQSQSNIMVVLFKVLYDVHIVDHNNK